MFATPGAIAPASAALGVEPTAALYVDVDVDVAVAVAVAGTPPADAAPQGGPCLRYPYPTLPVVKGLTQVRQITTDRARIENAA